MAEIREKRATDSQSQKLASGSFGADEAEVRPFAARFVYYVLRVVEAATALHFAIHTSIGCFRSRAARPRSLTDFAFGDAVADTNDHGSAITDNAKRSQEESQPRKYRLETNAVGHPTRTMCANSWVATDNIDGGQAAGKRSGTTMRFMTA